MKMLSKLDIAIRENLLKDYTCETFFNQVLIDHPGLDEVEEEFHDLELFRVCHLWQGQINSSGYGAFTLYSKIYGKKYTVKAHRFAFAHEFGAESLPEGVEGGDRYVLNHICHQRSCVNPYHLEVVTNKENVSREKRKPKDA